MRLSVCSVALLLAWAVNPPEKPGSATDVTGRMFAQKFSEAWGQPVVVENVSGNSGAIGLDVIGSNIKPGN